MDYCDLYRYIFTRPDRDLSCQRADLHHWSSYLLIDAVLRMTAFFRQRQIQNDTYSMNQLMVHFALYR